MTTVIDTSLHEQWQEVQRRFAAADAAVVACRALGLTRQGAYALRDRAAGAAFALV